MLSVCPLYIYSGALYLITIGSKPICQSPFVEVHLSSGTCSLLADHPSAVPVGRLLLSFHQLLKYKSR
jgi:hypothetical protein